MNKIELINKVKELSEKNFNLGFPHEDCIKVVLLAPECDWMKADLNTYFHSIWSLSAVEKLLNFSDTDLEKDKNWLEKSFFERFPKYTSAKQFITPVITPKLYESLNTNEDLRKLLLILVSAELMERKI